MYLPWIPIPLWRNLSARISEYKAKLQMNCAEPVKPVDILWKPFENPTITCGDIESAAAWPGPGRHRGQKNKCGWASHPAALFVDFLPCFSAAAAG